jgi:hypothetical protein
MFDPGRSLLPICLAELPPHPDMFLNIPGKKPGQKKAGSKQPKISHSGETQGQKRF